MRQTKKERQEKIKEIIQTKAIATQYDLLHELQALGFELTQATVSRDMKELALIKKIQEDGRWAYCLPPKQPNKEKQRLIHLLHQCYRFYRQQKEMLVIYTLPGSSPALGSLIMEIYDAFLFTVLTNDDHLLIIAKDEACAQQVLADLLSFQEEEVRT